MLNLFHLHIASLFIIYINFVILNKNMSDNLGSKYFLINYIYHHQVQFKHFIVFYPFIIISIYFIFGDIIPIGTFAISVLHVYFLFEIISRNDINSEDEYIDWYKQNVVHSFSMHAHDMLRKNFSFLREKASRASLFKFEITFFICIVIETEYMTEVIAVIENIK